MARPPDGITPRSATITGRYRPSTVASLDRMMAKDGVKSRAKFLEKLIVDEEKRRNQRGTK